MSLTVSPLGDKSLMRALMPLVKNAMPAVMIWLRRFTQFVFQSISFRLVDRVTTETHLLWGNRKALLASVLLISAVARD